MNTMHGDGWKRRGVALLWDWEALTTIANTNQVLSLQTFMALDGKWPDELPCADGDALVVAGLDGCLDTLTPNDAATWLESDIRDRLFSFQSEYEGQAALILWLPNARKRLSMSRATEEYAWSCGGGFSGDSIEIGRCIWGGAQGDLQRIINDDQSNTDLDGPAWIGLHHPRSS